MKAENRMLSEVLNGARVLEIPFFQRSYVWKEDQWKRMMADMEYVSTSNQEYFMGSLILKRLETPANAKIGDRRSVIDGQQRLTTLALFFKALSLKMKDSAYTSLFYLRPPAGKTLCIEHNYNDKKSFEKIMNAKKVQPLDEKSNGIEQAFDFFYKNINLKKINYHHIVNKLVFVGIDLLGDDNEQQIFNTINSLGVKLSTGELLKNRLFDKKKISFYEKTWKSVFEEDDDCVKYWDTSVTVGRNSVTMMDNFLYAYLQIKMHDPKLKKKINSEKKKDYRRFDNLFENYEDLLKILNNDDKFTCEMVEYAKIFRERFDQSVLTGEALTSEASLDRMLVLIYGLDVMTARPFLLYIEKNVELEEERNKMYAYLETYLVRRFICGSTNNNYSDLFTENMIGQGINTFEKLKKYIENKKIDDALSMPSDDDLKIGFKDSEKKNNTKAKTVLYLMESKIRDDEKYSTKLLPFNSYTLEHLMPKKWRNKWNEPELSSKAAATRDKKILTMGNFAIISGSLNSAISDDEWKLKLSGKGKNKGLEYYSSGIETMNDVCKQKKWDEKKIEKRAEWLAKKALSIWAV